jgi:hypothetical protein
VDSFACACSSALILDDQTSAIWFSHRQVGHGLRFLLDIGYDWKSTEREEAQSSASAVDLLRAGEAITLVADVRMGGLSIMARGDSPTLKPNRLARPITPPIREGAVFWADGCGRTPPLTPSAFHRLTTLTLQRA